MLPIEELTNLLFEQEQGLIGYVEAHARNSETPLQINHFTDVFTKDDIVYLAIPLSSTNASANDEFQNTIEYGIHS